jgi:hypothetical protein
VRGKALKPEVERTVEVMRTYESEEVFEGRMGLRKGQTKMLEGQEELETELVKLLNIMREAGQPLNSSPCFKRSSRGSLTGLRPLSFCALWGAVVGVSDLDKRLCP